MDKVSVNGEPVPETTGSTGVRWEDTPNRHAYCDAEIRRLREEMAALGARIGTVIMQAVADERARGEERLGKVRDLAARWTERDDRPAGERTAVSVTAAECGRQVLAVLGGACGECDGGLVDAGGCNCGGGGPDGYPPHERLCGLEPCPDGCWERLNPEAPASGAHPAAAGTDGPAWCERMPEPPRDATRPPGTADAAAELPAPLPRRVPGAAVIATTEAARAPFSPDQVASLNAFQASGAFHPFTCGNDFCPGIDGERVALEAREDGWHCPACDYTQDWAHTAMADGSWRDWQGITVRVLHGEPGATLLDPEANG